MLPIAVTLLVGLAFPCAMAGSNNGNSQSCNAHYEQLLPLVHPEPANIDPTAFKRAIVALDHALQKCPDHAGLVTLMAQAKLAVGNNTEAYHYAQRAVLLNASDWEANHTLGTVLTLMGDYNQGLPYLDKAVIGAPKQYRYNVLVNYCSSLEMAKRYQATVDACTEAIKIRNDHGATFYIRARAYQELGDKKLAERDFATAKKLGFDGDSYYSGDHQDKK